MKVVVIKHEVAILPNQASTKRNLFNSMISMLSEIIQTVHGITTQEDVIFGHLLFNSLR